MKKYLLTFTLTFFLNYIVFSQNYYEITYATKSKKRTTSQNVKNHFSKLYVYGKNSIYQWEAQYKLDSIRVKRKIEINDLRRYFSPERYAIEIEGNNLTFYDDFGGNEYQYSETLNLNWQLVNESKIIKGYTCKKATVSYGGRDWIAWYALELPLNAGPYKFKNLPGLILKITDATNSYTIEVFSINKKEKLPIKKLHHIKTTEERIIVNRNKFNQIKFKYNNLSFNEQLDIINKRKSSNLKAKFFSTDGQPNPFSKQRNSNKSKTLNLIEIDHKK